MLLHIGLSVILAGVLKGFALTGCSDSRQNEWKLSIISERVIDERDAVLTRPSSVLALGDTAIIVFQSDRADPVIIDTRTGIVVGELVASPDLLDSVMRNETVSKGGLFTPNLAEELAHGHFEWFEQQRETTYKPQYQNGCVLSDTSALLAALIPMPSIAWNGTTRLEGIRQALALVQIDLRTFSRTGCSLIEVNDECAPQSFAIARMEYGLMMGSLHAKPVIDGRTDSIHILARVETSGELLPERWYISDSVLKMNSWFAFTQPWSTYKSTMLGISSTGCALMYTGEKQLISRVYNLHPPVSKSSVAPLFMHPVLADFNIELAHQWSDSSSRDTIWSLAVYPLPSLPSDGHHPLATTSLNASEVGPGYSIPRKGASSHTATFARLVRRDEHWFLMRTELARGQQ